MDLSLMDGICFIYDITKRGRRFFFLIFAVACNTFVQFYVDCQYFLNEMLFFLLRRAWWLFIYVKIVMRILIFRTNFMGIKNDLPSKNIYYICILYNKKKSNTCKMHLGKSVGSLHRNLNYSFAKMLLISFITYTRSTKT